MSERRRSVLIGKTCNTVFQAKKFVDKCIEMDMATIYWVSEFLTGETGEGKEEEAKRVLVTFWMDKDEMHRLGDVGRTMILHRKPNGTLFTINALNKLIQEDDDTEKNEKGEVVLNWDKYRNKLICMLGGQLGIYEPKLLYKVVHKK